MEHSRDIEVATSGMGGLALSALFAESLDEVLTAVVQADRVIAAASSLRARLIDEARRWSEIEAGRNPGSPVEVGTTRRILVSELACALRIPERSADNLAGISSVLVSSFPATLAALGDGQIGYRHAQVIVDQLSGLPQTDLGSQEVDALRLAQTLTASQLERRLRAKRERLHPESIAKRHTAAVENRCVELVPARDGMAWISALLPAPQAVGAYNYLTDLAIAARTPGDERTLPQRRADSWADRMLGQRSEGGGIRPRVLVAVPVLSMLKRSTEPAELEGYGPIDADTARELAAEAPSFVRILTHPESSAILSVGRDRYTVPKDLKTWLRLRDATCRFPGCSRPAERCDIDHTESWSQGHGRTEHDNLAHLCRWHHRLKHTSAWQVTQSAGGTLHWQSPTGRRYETRAAVAMPAVPAVDQDAPSVRQRDGKTSPGSPNGPPPF